MTYSIKEIFYTLQGEGLNAGQPAVFCRFAGCNLWSGREQHRPQALCSFCDTDFVGVNGVGGGKFRQAESVVEAVVQCWPTGSTGKKWVVCTGGEPLLQLDAALIQAFHQQDFTIAVETNGTQLAPPGIDWLCVSPKAGAPLLQTRGDELKLIYPQPGLMPESLLSLHFQHFLLQPLDNAEQAKNTQAAIDYCLAHPDWRLSVQIHKTLGIP